MIIEKITDFKQIYLNEDLYALMALAFYSPTQGKIKNAVESLYSKQQGKFYIAKIDDEIVGIIGAKRIDNSKLELNHLAVKETHRGKGIAKQLIYDLLVAENVPLMTTECNQPLVKFYKHCGFKVFTNPEEALGGYAYKCRLEK